MSRLGCLPLLQDRQRPPITGCFHLVISVTSRRPYQDLLAALDASRYLRYCGSGRLISQAAVQGRVGILQVHSRNKKIEEGLDYHKVARATAGFTGAELMNLMNTAAIVAVRRGAKIITEADVFQVCTQTTWPMLVMSSRRSSS